MPSPSRPCVDCGKRLPPHIKKGVGCRRCSVCHVAHRRHLCRLQTANKDDACKQRRKEKSRAWYLANRSHALQQQKKRQQALAASRPDRFSACLECGCAIQLGRGQGNHVRIRCDACGPIHAKVSARQRYVAKLMAGPDLWCGDCGLLIEPKINRGPVRPRCAYCRRLRENLVRKLWKRICRTSSDQIQVAQREWRKKNPHLQAIYKTRYAPRVREIRANWSPERKQKELNRTWWNHIRARWFKGLPIPEDMKPAIQLIREFRLRLDR